MIWTDGTPTVVSQGVSPICICTFGASPLVCKCARHIDVGTDEDKEYGIYDDEA